MTSMKSGLATSTLAIHGGTPVRTEPIPWELPGMHWIGQEEAELVADVVKRKSPFRYYGPDLGHMADTLEKEFAGRLGRKYALATASASAALSCAMAALEIGPGDEVLIPGYLWVSCISAVVRAGGIPRLVDIDDTFCVSPEDLARKITPRSKALLLIHMSGAPGDLDPIFEITRKAGLRVVEDGAQSNGSTYKGKPIGSFGDIGLFSFQLNKNMTSGEGGILVTDDEHLYKRCFAAHDMGYARNAQGRLDPLEEKYQLWGMGARMSELCAAMALAQHRKLGKIVGAMHHAKYTIKNELEKIDGLKFRRIVDPEGDSGPFLIVTLPSAPLSKSFAEALEAEGIRGPEGSCAFIHMEGWHYHWHWNNVSLVNRRSLSSTGWPWTAPENAFAKDYSYARGTLPNCDDLASRSLLLTIASCLTDKDVNDIVEAYSKVAEALL